MSHLSQGTSELDARLAELDRKLRAIQTDLAPHPEAHAAAALDTPARDAAAPPPEPPAPPPEPAPAPGRPEPQPERPEPAHSGRSGPLATALAQARVHQPPPPLRAPETLESERLVSLHEHLLIAMGELIEANRKALQRLAPAPALTSPSPPQPQGESADVALVASPFAGRSEVERFRQHLSGLPSVAAVTLLGYAGSDGALLEVRLRAEEETTA